MTAQDNLYINLLKKVLTGYDRLEYGEYKPLYQNHQEINNYVYMPLDKLVRMRKGYMICTKTEFDPELRKNGLDFPATAVSMIGLKRMDNIQYCVSEVVKNNVEGDLIETGVWRGGACIFMKAMLKVLNAEDRTVWVADSFEGLPEANTEKYAWDKGDKHHVFKELAVSKEQVMHNFEKYELLDDKVKFLKGWFKDTLPTAPITKLAVLRLDGDMYESTMDGLVNLYPKVSVGGYIIVDDYSVVKGCKAAIDDYIKANNITADIITIDQSSVYWKKVN